MTAPVYTPTCETCGHHQMIAREQWGKYPLPRCIRDRTLRDGTVLKHLDVGSSVNEERSSFTEHHRVPGDKCGPSGKNWIPKGGAQ